MNRSLALALGLSAFSPSLLLAATDDSNPDSSALTPTIEFLNGDKLPGSIASLTLDQASISSPILNQATTFSTNSLLSATFPGFLPDTKNDHEAVITLTNNDVIIGSIQAVTDKEISVLTPFAGTLKIRRPNIQSVALNPIINAIYQGPTSTKPFENWVVFPKVAWNYQSGAFISNSVGTLGKEKILPDEFNLSFNLSWSGSRGTFKINLFTDDINTNKTAQGYQLIGDRGEIYARSNQSGGTFGSIKSESFQKYKSAAFKLQVSKKNRTINLYLNNELVGAWKDTNATAPTFGSGLQFLSSDSTPIKISKIQLTPWDGVNEQADQFAAKPINLGRFFEADQENAPTPTKEPNDGRLELTNGDSIDGTPSQIQDGTAHIKSSLGEFKIPIARLKAINLNDPKEEAILRKGDIRTTFPNGSSIVFDLKSVNADSVTGSSQNFGTATFDLKQISRIDFNIHKEEAKALHSQARW